MSFTSYDFLLFYLILFILYWVIRERRWQNLILLAASFVFYAWMQTWYALLLGASILADFLLARGMRSNPMRKKQFMGMSLIVNIGVLAFFKYFSFFSGSVNNALENIGIRADAFLLAIVLPAGLSFFTLKKLGYMIDVSRGTLQPTHSLVDFALYVAFFPQIVAGPIERPQKLLPQIESARSWTAEYLYAAWPLLVMGFFKKLVIANSIKVIVDRIFGFSEPTGFLLMCGALGFSLQILADFSAYTDLSRGIALLLGFKTSENFNLPYTSLTPTDFWNRWHITLSNWLRDYIFFPIRRALMQSRIKLNERLSIAIPPLATMFISGLWHGAGWTYILWGVYYGVLIAAYQWIGIRGDWKPTSKIKNALAWLVMFAFIVFGWAMFRAPNIHWLGNALFNTPFINSQNDLVLGLIALTMTLAYSLPLIIKSLLDRYSKDSWGQAAYYAIAAALIVIYINSASSDFIYVQF